jgi:SNF2 family DNA or RNA helicase
MSLIASPSSPRSASVTRGGDALRFKVEAAYGRLYLSGPDASVFARKLKGVVMNPRRRSYEVSLTLETLMAIRDAAGMTGQQLARRCDPSVMRWARAARKSQDAVLEIHRKIEAGYLTDLPWLDRRAGTEAPTWAPPSQVDDGGLYTYRAPYHHQQIMATVATEISGLSFIADMGTGKTRAAIEAMAHHGRNKLIDMYLVECPAGVTGVWEDEIGDWTDDLEPTVLDGSVKMRSEWIGDTAQAIREGSFLAPRVPVAITNYEALPNHRKLESGKDGRRGMIDSIMEAGVNLGIVLDEGHRIRNPTSLVSKAAMQIAQVGNWRLHMTGTPILNGLQNIWSQWYFVDLGVTFGSNFVQFRREFFDEDPYTFSSEPSEGTVDEFNARLHVRGLRFTKEDCLDLPPKVFTVHEVQMTKEQSLAYQDMRDQLLVDLDSMEDEEGTASASIILTQILRLTQITSGFLPRDQDEPEDDPVRFARNPKLDALVMLVEECVLNHLNPQAVIVWAWYREDIRAINEALAHLSPVTIAGGMSRGDREAAETAFKRGETRLLIGNPASAGVGLNLQAASVAFYYSQSYNLEHRAQSEDRCHRSGSEIHDSVTYVDLVCKDTIDEAVRNVLAGKMALADAVVEIREAL